MTLKVVVIGGGWMGQLHSECLTELPDTEVVGLVEPSAQSAADFRSRFAVPVFDDVRTAVRNTGADLACICTPTGLHAQHAVEAVAAGCHVVVEKPLATSVDDAHLMLAAAAAAGRSISVIMQYRYHRDALLLKRALSAGALGDIVFANVTNYIQRDAAYFAANGGWRGTWEHNGGGILINQSTHGMDLLHWYAGGATAVSAVAETRFHAVEVEDTLSAVLRFDSGASGVVQVTSGAHRNHPLRLEVVGSRGHAVFERARLSVFDVEHPDRPLLSESELAALPVSPAEAFGEAFGQAHRRQFRAIALALAKGEQPEVQAQDALGSLVTISSIYDAAGVRPSVAQLDDRQRR